MESSDFDELMSLVDRYAGYLTDDPAEGLKRIVDELGVDSALLRGMLSIIALHHKEHAPYLLNYMTVGLELKHRDNPGYQEHLKSYAPFRNFVTSQLDLIGLALFHGKMTTVEGVIGEIVEELDKLAHDRLIRTTPVVNTDDAIFQGIESLQKSLNRLSDFITIANEHKTLKEMAVIQKLFDTLTADVQKYV
ncbi:hypothetical protein [Chryseolinea lacunae]|uniref:Uncharacterized protein n=1 Tax=Chryseolinea lacunae TaxID=2801331 RepID=A0ABS1KP56_9BACT|nr:hypothetical protein [Chryseolinea lacunae]MBL0741234.1 hypothetical protein [Chryseolinea lacunae]